MDNAFRRLCHMSALPTPGPFLCTEEEVGQLVHRFYARVREDPLLGPVFDAHVHDWPGHLATLADFWSAMLRGTRRFQGAPVTRHMAIPGMTEAMFLRWLDLFAQTTAESGNRGLQEVADHAAERVAGNFWHRYQVQNQPFRTPRSLRPGGTLPIVGS